MSDDYVFLSNSSMSSFDDSKIAYRKKSQGNLATIFDAFIPEINLFDSLICMIHMDHGYAWWMMHMDDCSA